MKSRGLEWGTLRVFTCACLSDLRCQTPGYLLGQPLYTPTTCPVCPRAFPHVPSLVNINTSLWKDSCYLPISQMGRLELRGVRQSRSAFLDTSASTFPPSKQNKTKQNRGTAPAFQKLTASWVGSGCSQAQIFLLSFAVWIESTRMG